MKNILFIIAVIFVSNVKAQIITFQDPTFKTVLINTICADIDGDGTLDSSADLNNDGEIEISEAEAVFGLEFSDSGIKSLAEIPFFINLKRLIASRNLVTTIDLSQNLMLERLYIGNNELSALDVSQNSLLEQLVAENMNITAIDLSQNQNLEILDLSDNPLNEIDVSQNQALLYLFVERCSINELDVTNLTNLIGIDVSWNNMSSLDLSQNTQLYDVFVSNCANLVELDLSNSINLRMVVCFRNNNLAYLNIQNGSNIFIEQLWAFESPQLTCIQVDDVEYAENQLCVPPGFNGWCIDNWTAYSENCALGYDDYSKIDLVLSPNPVLNIMNIYTDVPVGNIQIYSIGGQLLGSYSETQIDVSNLVSGIYFLTIEINGRVIIKKFVKAI